MAEIDANHTHTHTHVFKCELLRLLWEPLTGWKDLVLARRVLDEEVMLECELKNEQMREVVWETLQGKGTMHAKALWQEMGLTVSEGEESSFSGGDLGSIPGSGQCPGEGNGNPL